MRVSICVVCTGSSMARPKAAPVATTYHPHTDTDTTHYDHLEAEAETEKSLDSPPLDTIQH